MTLLVLTKVTQLQAGLPLAIKRVSSPLKLAHASVAEYLSRLASEAMKVAFLLEDGSTTVITSHLRLRRWEFTMMSLWAKP